MSRKGCDVFDAGLVAQMQDIVRGRTDEALTAQFGISYNTWRKLVDGKPIRKSVADRLIERMAVLGETS